MTLVVISLRNTTYRAFRLTSRISAIVATSLALVAVTACLASAQDKWSFKEWTDDLTDLKVAVASYPITRNSGAHVSCEQRPKGRGMFRTYITFGEYLNDRMVSFRYRIDKGPLVEDQGLATAKGTGVTISYDAGVTRQMMRGYKMIAEATDFRGLSHRIRFSLIGAMEAIKPVMQLCGFSRIALHDKIQGLRRELSLEMEQWGPIYIKSSKKILQSLDLYDGAIDSNIESSFALSVQEFYDKQLSECNNRKNPVTARTWCSISNVIAPEAGMMIYEAASGDLRDKAGKLHFRD